MRRTYDRDRYLRLVAKLRDAIPGVALGTDLIVGFGVAEEDFRETLAVVEHVRYDSAFTFIYFSSAGHRGGCDAGPGAGGGQARAARAARRGRPADRGRAERAADRHRSRRCSSRASAASTRLCCGRTRGNVTVNFAGNAEAAVDVLSRARRRRRSAARSGRRWPHESALTGSSGQIGTNLALRLPADGHEVFGVDQRVNTWTDEFRT